MAGQRQEDTVIYRLEISQHLKLAHFRLLLRTLNVTEIIVRADSEQSARRLADNHEKLSSDELSWSDLPPTAWLDTTPHNVQCSGVGRGRSGNSE